MPAASDLAMLDGDELTSRLGESRRELFNLRFQLAKDEEMERQNRHEHHEAPHFRKESD